jgi:uncharacterized protein (TIGR02284 family)
MSDSSNILPELIEASRDGGEFYAEAAESVKDAELSKLFKRMARAKADLATELSNEVDTKSAKSATKVTKTAKGAKAPAANGWVGEIHAVYRDLRPGMKAIRQDQVTRIEETENQLLGRIQQVRHDKENSYVVRVLAMQYETHARALGEALRARKRRLTAAQASTPSAS